MKRIQYKYDQEFFTCICNSDEHTLRFILDPEDGEIFVSAFLDEWPYWYVRVWRAIKYVFGYKCKYGHWDSFIMDYDDYNRFHELLNKSVEYKKEYVNRQAQSET